MRGDINKKFAAKNVKLVPCGMACNARDFFCRWVNRFIIIFLVWVLICYKNSPQILVDFYGKFAPFLPGIFFPFLYAEWLADASSEPELTRAYVSVIYLCFIFLFLNLLLAVVPVFRGAPNRHYRLSNSGFAEFLEENIFGKLSPSISLLNVGRFLWGDASLGGRFIEVDSFRECVAVYLRRYFLRYYGGLSIAAFFLLPWVAYQRIQSTHIGLVPFFIVVIFFSYSQIRLLFELLVLLSSFSRNSRS